MIILCTSVITVLVVHQTMTVSCLCAGVITALVLSGPPDRDYMLSVCRCDHSLGGPPDPVVDDCGDNDRQPQRVGHEVHAVHCSSQHLP